MSEISLKIKSDFEQAAADFKRLGTLSESMQKNIAKLQEQFEKGSIDKFIERNKLAATAITATRGSAAGLEAEFKGLQKEIERLIRGGIDPQSEALQKLKSRYAELAPQVVKTESSFSSMMKTASAFGLGLGMYDIANKFVDIGKSAIDAAINLEATQTAFTVMLGNAEKAQSLLTELKNLADYTPYTKEDLQQNAKLLLNYGVAAEKVTGIMSMLGDVAMGDNERLGRLTLVFGQIQAAGKLTGDNLKQMVEVGFNPLQKMAGGSAEKYQQLVS